MKVDGVEFERVNPRKPMSSVRGVPTRLLGALTTHLLCEGHIEHVEYELLDGQRLSRVGFISFIRVGIHISFRDYKATHFNILSGVGEWSCRLFGRPVHRCAEGLFRHNEDTYDILDYEINGVRAFERDMTVIAMQEAELTKPHG